MGGDGSGRKPNVETIIKQQQPEETPIGSGIFLPNYSGLKPTALKTNYGWLVNGTSLYYNSGSVGIGTTSPQSKFEVSDNTLEVLSMINNTRTTNGYSGLMLYSQNASAMFYLAGAGATNPGRLTIGGANDTAFITNLGTTSDVRIFINGSTGNVGIGTASPNAKLAVVGMISGSSLLADNGFTGTITTGSLVGKTITISGGIIIGFA